MNVAEIEISTRLVKLLNPYFELYPEVWSKCRFFRIDYILKERLTGQVFGMEVKKISKKRGVEMGCHAVQAIKYSQVEFENFGKVPVFIAPPISYDWWICPDHENMKLIDGNEYFKDRHNKNSDHHTGNGVLCAFNIGELRKEVIEPTKWNKGGTYFRIIFCNKVVWSNKPKYNSTELVGIDKRWYDQLIKKINGQV